MIMLPDARETELTSEEVKDLAAICGNESFRKAVGKVLAVRGEMDRLSSIKLSGPEGLHNAARQQGEVRGMLHAFQILFDLAREDE
jgi:hypothetical protein